MNRTHAIRAIFTATFAIFATGLQGFSADTADANRTSSGRVSTHTPTRGTTRPPDHATLRQGPGGRANAAFRGRKATAARHKAKLRSLKEIELLPGLITATPQRDGGAQQTWTVDWPMAAVAFKEDLAAMNSAEASFSGANTASGGHAPGLSWERRIAIARHEEHFRKAADRINTPEILAALRAIDPPSYALLGGAKPATTYPSKREAATALLALREHMRARTKLYATTTARIRQEIDNPAKPIDPLATAKTLRALPPGTFSALAKSELVSARGEVDWNSLLHAIGPELDTTWERADVIGTLEERLYDGLASAQPLPQNITRYNGRLREYLARNEPVMELYRVIATNKELFEAGLRDHFVPMPSMRPSELRYRLRQLATVLETKDQITFALLQEVLGELAKQR